MLDRFFAIAVSALIVFFRAFPERLGAFYQTYLASLRWVEFVTAVTVAYQGAVQVAPMLLGVSQEVGEKIGVYVAVVGALCYLRNPKQKEWSDALDTPVAPPSNGTFARDGE